MLVTPVPCCSTVTEENNLVCCGIDASDVLCETQSLNNMIHLHTAECKSFTKAKDVTTLVNCGTRGMTYKMHTHTHTLTQAHTTLKAAACCVWNALWTYTGACGVDFQ